MHQVLVARPSTTCPSKRIEIHNGTMALRSVGCKPSQALPTKKRQVKFKIVAVDYFIKWAEAKPLVSITSKIVTKFL